MSVTYDNPSPPVAGLADDPVTRMNCPKCGSPYGTKCVGPSGKNTTTHRERHEALDAVKRAAAKQAQAELKAWETRRRQAAAIIRRCAAIAKLEAGQLTHSGIPLADLHTETAVAVEHLARHGVLPNDKYFTEPEDEEHVATLRAFRSAAELGEN